jgi:flagellar protein FlaF
MYRFSYAEVQEDGANEARARERQGLDRALALLKVAAARGPQSPEAIEAVRFLQDLWGFFIQDLADPANDLAEQLRADLISIGLWVIKESDRVISERSNSFSDLIDVNTAIRDGLQ